MDAQEGRGPVVLLEGAGPAELLGRARRIAVVGASPSPERPSYGVMRYLLGQGYDCVPINPNTLEVLGRRAFPNGVSNCRAPLDMKSRSVAVWKKRKPCF